MLEKIYLKAKNVQKFTDVLPCVAALHAKVKA